MTDPFNDFSSAEDALWSDAFGEEFFDPTAQALFHAAYFAPGEYEPDELSAIREQLASYLDAEYDIDFNEVFNWDAWREAYE